MTVQKLTFDNKTNLFPIVLRTKQATAEDFNEIKAKFNANVDEIIAPSTEDFEVTGTTGSYVMQLKTRQSENGQQGYVIIRDDFDWESIHPDYANFIFEIRDIQDVNGAEIVLPANVTLKFEGGQIINATSITGDNTRIEAGLTQIFDADAGTTYLGTWIVDKVYPQWWGAVGDGIADDTLPVQAALNFGGTVYFVNGTYTISYVEAAVNGTHILLSSKAVIQSTISFDIGIKISGNNCIMEGGTFFMPPVFDPSDVEWVYAGIYITGTNVLVKGVTLDNVQKVGIGFKNTSYCYVENCTINGNFGTYGSSYNGADVIHFGIAFAPGGTGGTFVATNNTINTCIQGIYYKNFGITTDEYGVLITDNTISKCFNHAIYCLGGEGQVISDNNCSYCGQAIAVQCFYGAVVSNNSIYLGKTDDPLSDEVGILLIDPIGAVCSGNNINGNGKAGSAAVILTNIDGDAISENVITNNIIKITTTAACDLIQFGNNSLTTFMKNNVISHNVLNGPCIENHGAIYTEAHASCVSHNNVISNNNITVHVVNDLDAGIYIHNNGGFIIKENNIVIAGNALSAIAAYGIYSISEATYLGEILNNRISVFENDGDNMNIVGIKITTGTGILLIEGNKLDASLSDALSYAIVSCSNANAILKKNINDLRVATSGVVTIAIAGQTAALPVGNFELEGSGLNIIKNILIRPINTGAVAEVGINKVWAAETIAGQPKIYLQAGATYSSSFAWEII